MCKAGKDACFTFVNMCWKMQYRLVICVLMLSLFVPVAAQIKFVVIPSKTVVAQNETFQLQFVIEGTTQVDDFKAPSFRNFEQLSGLDQANGWTWVNGALSEYVSYTILLRPKIKRKLPVASAVAKVKGKLITSAPLTIVVTETGTTTQSMTEERPDYYLLPGENVKEKISKNLFIKATIDKHTCYVGEPVLATFKLFTRLDSESKIVKRPSLNGFSVIELEEPEAGIFSKEMYNGKLFNCYLIRKVQLFPLQSGMISIEPVEVENIVRMIKAKTGSSKETGTWLDAMMEKMQDAEISSENIIEEKLLLKTEELKVNVLELPQKNKPETFNGAVGNFTMEAGLLNNEIAANDNATLRISIKGRGNIPMITTPIVNWPAGVDSFEAKMTEEINKTSSPISGSKTFDIPFSVAKTGMFEIPSVRFSYFDEKTRSYQTITTKNLQLNVTAAVKRKLPVQTGSPAVNESNPSWVWVAGGGGLLLLLAGGLLFFVQRKKQTDLKEKVAVVKEEEIKPIKTVAAYLQPAVALKDGLHQKQFYTLLMEAVQLFLTDRLQLNEQVVNNAMLAEVLKQKEWNDLAAQFQLIMNECEMLVFSGVEVSDAKDQLLISSIELMKETDRRVSCVY